MMTKSFTAPLLLLVIALCSAVVSASESEPFQRIDILNVKSVFNGEPMPFTVTLPPSYSENKDKRYVVLFWFN